MEAQMVSDSERRIFDRFDARFPAKIKDTRDEFGTSIHLRDASAQGAKLTSKERLYINDSITLEVELPDADNPMNLKGQVVWAKSSEAHGWDVGLRFHKISLMHMSRLYKFVS